MAATKKTKPQDAIALLKQDHEKVRTLLASLERATGARRSKLLTQIDQELKVHTKIEEEIFYPAITQLDEEIHELVTEGVEEHHVVETLMGEARFLTPADEEWAAKIKVLIENVEHHAGEEEEDMFPMVRKAMDDDARAQLGQQMEARKAQLGAPTVADKASLSTEELQALAREQEIPGRSSMKRDELIATVAPRS